MFSVKEKSKDSVETLHTFDLQMEFWCGFSPQTFFCEDASVHVVCYIDKISICKCACISHAFGLFAKHRYKISYLIVR